MMKWGCENETAAAPAYFGTRRVDEKALVRSRTHLPGVKGGRK